MGNLDQGAGATTDHHDGIGERREEQALISPVAAVADRADLDGVVEKLGTEDVLTPSPRVDPDDLEVGRLGSSGSVSGNAPLRAAAENGDRPSLQSCDDGLDEDLHVGRVPLGLHAWWGLRASRDGEDLLDAPFLALVHHRAVCVGTHFHH